MMSHSITFHSVYSEFSIVLQSETIEGSRSLQSSSVLSWYLIYFLEKIAKNRNKSQKKSIAIFSQTKTSVQTDSICLATNSNGQVISRNTKSLKEHMVHVPCVPLSFVFREGDLSHLTSENGVFTTVKLHLSLVLEKLRTRQLECTIGSGRCVQPPLLSTRMGGSCHCTLWTLPYVLPG